MGKSPLSAHSETLEILVTGVSNYNTGNSIPLHNFCVSIKWNWIYHDEMLLGQCQISVVQLTEVEWRIYASIIWPSLVKLMACRLVNAKALSEPSAEKLLIGHWPLGMSLLQHEIFHTFNRCRQIRMINTCRSAIPDHLHCILYQTKTHKK